ncbi:MAG: hypothetical protein U0324_00380 [Polyangiales bacterium]
MRAPPPTLRLVAWALVALGAVVLWRRYDALPARVPVFRGVGGAEVLRARSFLSVGRLVALGAAQAGAASAMARASREHPGWRRFWNAAAAVAGLKTLLECAGFAQRAPRVERACLAGTALAVGAFLVVAARWWRRGELRAPPRPSRGTSAALALAFVLWALAVAVPALLPPR